MYQCCMITTGWGESQSMYNRRAYLEPNQRAPIELPSYDTLLGSRDGLQLQPCPHNSFSAALIYLRIALEWMGM